MEMVKKLTLAASILLAMSLAFGCSDDKEEKEEKEEAKWCALEALGAPGLYACYEIGKRYEQIDDERFTMKMCTDYGFGVDVILSPTKPDVNCMDLGNEEGEEETFEVITIGTPQQLIEFAQAANGGNNFKNKIIKLEADIMLNDTANWQDWANNPPANEWEPIAIHTNDENEEYNEKAFKGVFDGNGYIVSGVYINSANDGQGLFGNVDSYGTIKNLGVVASYIKGVGDVGGLVGNNGYGDNNGNGMISGCYFIGEVASESDFSVRVGGLVGSNAGTISNSYFSGKVTGINATFNRVGGLVGNNFNGTISNSYSSGKVTGTDGYFSEIGGLVGSNSNRSSGAISNSYYDMEISGQSDTGKGEGKSTAEMKQKATFANWDFDNVWGISSGINEGYPYLQK